MSISVEGSPKARIVVGLLRDGDRVLLCHRSPRRRWYPDVWDLPGGHVEPGELPGAALARELREELGIEVAAPSGPPVREVRADTFDMQIWLIEAWTGSPVNVAPDKHDAIGWFTEDALGELSLAHDGYLAMFSKVLAEPRDLSRLGKPAAFRAKARPIQGYPVTTVIAIVQATEGRVQVAQRR